MAPGTVCAEGETKLWAEALQVTCVELGVFVPSVY